MADFKRSPCPIANVLDVFGDKWTMLVVRDLVLGKKTYKQFQDSPEGIPTNILADRLKRLQLAGIIEKKPYQERPPRYTYHLTDKGMALGPILREMITWANKHVPGTLTDDEIKQIKQSNSAK